VRGGNRRLEDRAGDEAVMQGARRGEIGAFEQIYDRHGAVAFSVAYAILRDHRLAEEATQDAFLAVWRKAGDYRPDVGSVRTWLLAILRYRCFDALRRTARDPWYVPSEELDGHGPERDATVAEVIRRDEAGTVRSALANLPAEQRRAIALAYFGGLTHVEIARRLEVPLGTIKGRLRLGLERLRQDIVREAAQSTGQA
jgi:RNA polymerase sigma-70 factor, ECF subfamily